MNKSLVAVTLVTHERVSCQFDFDLGEFSLRSLAQRFHILPTCSSIQVSALLCCGLDQGRGGGLPIQAAFPTLLCQRDSSWISPGRHWQETGRLKEGGFPPTLLHMHSASPACFPWLYGDHNPVLFLVALAHGLRQHTSSLCHCLSGLNGHCLASRLFHHMGNQFPF